MSAFSTRSSRSTHTKLKEIRKRTKVGIDVKFNSVFIDHVTVVRKLRNVLWFSSQVGTCRHTRWRLHTVYFNAEHQAGQMFNRHEDEGKMLNRHEHEDI